MAIPWATALYMFRKVLPVVIEKAPELLKTLERRRTASPEPDSPPADLALALLQERIETQEQVTAAQTELLTQQQATLRATRRSLTIAWTVLVAAILLGATIAMALLFRS